MPQPKEYDLSPIRATSITFSDRVLSGQREARGARACADALTAAGLGHVATAVVPEQRGALESQVRGAIAAGSLTGACTGDPALDAVAGLWRAGVRLNGWMPDLRGRSRPAAPGARTLLAALHRDVVGPLAVAGRLGLEEVAAPRPPGRAPVEAGPGPAPDGEELAARLEGLVRLIEAPALPALVRAAHVHAEMVVIRPFTAGNAAVGRLLVRHLIARDGLEPTGVAVVDAYAGRAPAAYADAAAAYASGTVDGVVAWVVWQAEAVLVGLDEARGICRSVQAGMTTAAPADPAAAAGPAGAGAAPDPGAG